MQCPKCLGADISVIGDSHYVCNNPNCKMANGARTQFRRVPDERVHFPYNQIFVNRGAHEFVRYPYLELENVGIQET